MKKALLIAGAVLLAVLLLVAVVGPILNALGVEVFCLADDNGRTRLIRCGGENMLTADPNPPIITSDAQPMLIDTDMAIDDWMAILYLLQLPNVDVRAITVTGAGEAHCGPGVQNALDLAALAGRPDIPVSCGRETPLQGDRVFPQSWRDNVDSLSGITLPTSPSQPSNQEAVEIISSLIRASEGDLTIMALGPLTNLAEAVEADPSLASQIKQLYIMGGAFYVPGNVSIVEETNFDNDTAEWNIFVDPLAAAVVVESGTPTTFVPLDASNHVLLDEDFYNRLGEDRATPEAEFLYQALTESIAFVRSNNYYFWDPLTAALAIDESLGTFETQPVAVIQQDGPESGATRVVESGTSVRIAVAADDERFKQHFLDILNGQLSG